MIISIEVDSRSIAQYKKLKDLNKELDEMMASSGASNDVPKSITSEIVNMEIRINTMRSRLHSTLLDASLEAIENKLKQGV